MSVSLRDGFKIGSTFYRNNSWYFRNFIKKIKTYHDKDFLLGSFSIFHFQFSICNTGDGSVC